MTSPLPYSLYTDLFRFTSGIHGMYNGTSLSLHVVIFATKSKHASGIILWDSISEAEVKYALLCVGLL